MKRLAAGEQGNRTKEHELYYASYVMAVVHVAEAHEVEIV